MRVTSRCKLASMVQLFVIRRIVILEYSILFLLNFNPYDVSVRIIIIGHDSFLYVDLIST